MWKPESGGEKWFCGDRGSSLFGRNPNHADPIGIRTGTFDDDPGIRPSTRHSSSAPLRASQSPTMDCRTTPRVGTQITDPRAAEDRDVADTSYRGTTSHSTSATGRPANARKPP